MQSQNQNPTNTHQYSTPLSTIPPQPLHWLWHKRILRGKLTILEGDPGLGKSLLTLDLAARLTTGQPMPDGTPGLQGSVILIAPEDGAADTLRPRIEVAGGDPSHIHLLTVIKTGDPLTGKPSISAFTLSKHLPILAETIKHHNAVLVVIDPLMAILGRGINASSDQDIKQILIPLSVIADHNNCAILIVRHLNKGSSTNPLYRGGGSIGIIGSARTALLVVPDPSDDHKRVLVTIKNNLSARAENFTYQVIANAQDTPSIQWLGTNSYPLSSLFGENSNLSFERQDLLKALQESSRPLGPKELAEHTGQNHKSVRQMLRRMLNAGDIISPAYGLYTAHLPSSEQLVSQNSTVTPTTPATPVTPATVSASHSNFDTIPTTPATPVTPATVSASHSNFTPPPDPQPTFENTPAPPETPSPPPAPSPLPDQTPPTPQAAFETTIEKLKNLLHCTHKAHHLHWILTPTRAGCPICDNWLPREAAHNPNIQTLHHILTHHPPHPNETNSTWLHRITPLLL